MKEGDLILVSQFYGSFRFGGRLSFAFQGAA